VSESDAERIARQVERDRKAREAEEKQIADRLRRELEGGAS
jgi:hypothetical protein